MAEATNVKSTKKRLNIGKFFREIKSELKKVTWPTKNQVINNTLIVIALVIIVGLFIFILDTVFSFVSTHLLQGDFVDAFKNLFSFLN